MRRSLLDQMLSRYEIHTKVDRIHALREVMQQTVLAGLYRGEFFEKAAFYGGTCLRLFYGLQRFSEDMDFSLLRADDDFRLDNYFDAIIAEFETLGRDVVITRKAKKAKTHIESAFLKDTTEIYNLAFSTEKTVKIKIEVDTLPPSGFSTEHKLLLLPFSFMVRCYTLPDLFAGKMHALLFRNWKTRVKGRDWYDFEWYVRNTVRLNFHHLQERAAQINAIGTEVFTPVRFGEMLKERITQTDLEQVKKDVRPFLKNPSETDIWSTDYFLQLTDRIKFNNHDENP